MLLHDINPASSYLFVLRSSIRVVPNEERFPLAQFDLLSSLQDVPSEEGIVNVQFEVCDVGELCGGKRLVTVKDVASTGNESASMG